MNIREKSSELHYIETAPSGLKGFHRVTQIHWDDIKFQMDILEQSRQPAYESGLPIMMFDDINAGKSFGFYELSGQRIDTSHQYLLCGKTFFINMDLISNSSDFEAALHVLIDSIIILEGTYNTAQICWWISDEKLYLAGVLIFDSLEEAGAYAFIRLNEEHVYGGATPNYPEGKVLTKIDWISTSVPKKDGETFDGRLANQAIQIMTKRYCSTYGQSFQRYKSINLWSHQQRAGEEISEYAKYALARVNWRSLSTTESKARGFARLAGPTIEQAPGFKQYSFKPELLNDTTLKGKIVIGPPIGLFTAEECEDLLRHHLYYINDGDSSTLENRKPITVNSTQDMTTKKGALEFTVDVKPFNPGNTLINLDIPQWQHVSSTLIGSKDGLTYTLDLSDLPEGELIQVDISGKPHWSRVLAQVLNGKLTYIDEEKVGPCAAESILLENNTLTIRLREPLRFDRWSIIKRHYRRKKQQPHKKPKEGQ